MEEGRKLQRISRTAKDPVKLRRAILVLTSAQGQTVKDITVLMQVGEDYVRDVIHAFNEQGLDALDPKCRETLRRILHAGKVSWKTTTTWKASTDPEFIAKMHRVLALYDTPPADGRVVCVDEFGPLNLMPRKGKA
ncbi:helix-turn-helix domain-containing protein [Streptomyces aureoversilis]|uniref:Helix-turn-helix domain-containing protein n=1 Tax=Streptomyces aureoversilis TaxID=67277 RepID=A0ABV9ZW39_9ACTN